MKNYEKYRDKIREYKGNFYKGNFCKDFIEPYILKAINNAKCYDISCSQCEMLRTLWLLEYYEEPETDWSKVKVDTPILVKSYEESAMWHKKHFAKYEDGKVCAWNNGETSWTTNGSMAPWNYAKLAESEKGGAR